MLHRMFMILTIINPGITPGCQLASMGRPIGTTGTASRTVIRLAVDMDATILAGRFIARLPRTTQVIPGHGDQLGIQGTRTGRLSLAQDVEVAG
jgi:hypothetical protein